MSREPVVVLDGNRFFVGDAWGDAGSGSEGLYADDVRVLRRWELTVDGVGPQVLGAGPDGGHAGCQVFGRVAGAGGVPGVGLAGGRPGVGLRRRLRVSRAGLRDSLTLTGSGRVTVRWAFDGDFLDLFEVKARELGKPVLFAAAVPPVSLRREWEPGRGVHRLSAAAGRWSAGVEVSVSPAGAPADDSVTVTVDLTPQVPVTVNAYVVLAGSARPAVEKDGPSPADGRPAAGQSSTVEPAVRDARPAADVLAGAEAAADGELARWRAAVPVLGTSWAGLAETYRKSVEDLAALRMSGPGGAVLPAAGVPWFVAVFGRDTILTCLLTLALGQDQARAALRALAALRSTGDDPARDAEPGKIPHEVRVGKLAALGDGLPYYGSVDSTPLFVWLAAETWRWTGDDDLARELEPALRAAMAWVDGPADLTGRGYVEFRRRSAHGLDVQSWKDSPTSMLFADGTRAEAPLAVCEVQGYAYAARLGLAAVARTVWGDGPYADRLEEAAADLRARFERDFWVRTPAGGHYALALDGAGRRVDSLTSDIGHLLLTGIVGGDRADRTADALLGPELFSGWGVRTMGTADRGYDAVAYHDGTVWPHDTALACAGLAAHGRRDDAAVLLRGLVDAAGHLGWRLPEVLTGHPRADTGFPVVYPTSCSPQAWASAAPVGALAAVLGLRPDRAAGRLTAAASVPADLDVTLTGVPALGRRWTVTARAGTTTVTPLPRGTTVATDVENGGPGST